MTGRLLIALLATFTGCLLPLSTKAQERCATTKVESQRLIRRPTRETSAQFEDWMKSRVKQLPHMTSATYTIPVVVHVLHNGTNHVTNISDAQILSQIDVLNKDFKRLNLDAVNTPPVFAAVAGSIDIDFVLAKRDPEGLATTGIIRTPATQSQWSISDQSDLKALSYWPAEDYLNIWVVNMGTNDIGFAQFPVTNSIAGLTFASEDRLTDGIVVDYRAFGTSDAGSFPLMTGYDKGRTATHEIGHFLGLRHIWGDMSTCADNDFVSDTPFQTGPTSLCPTHPQPSCSANKMFMNYMDYTYDNCMNLFTDGQVARMVVVLGESPRRLSLLTSLGATPPVVAANDLGLRRVIDPGERTCLHPLTPNVEIRNYGTNTITSATLEMAFTGPTNQSVQMPIALNLAPGEITTHSFDPVSLVTGATYQFEFSIISTNGGVDGNPENDESSQEAYVYPLFSLPISEGFLNVPSTWSLHNPDNQLGWMNVVAPDDVPSNRAMKMDFYNYEIPGVLDWLLAPAITLATPPSSLLRFDVAYAMYPGLDDDILRVYALPGCDPDLDNAVLLYEKAGTDLSTTSSRSSSFTPASVNDWRKSEVISLSGLSSNTPWQLAFVGRNGYGNNLYLDNVLITENEVIDIAFAGVVSPGIVHCDSEPVIQFKVTNFGTAPVYSFTTEYTVNGGSLETQTVAGIELEVGETETYSLEPVTLTTGANQINLTVSLPNGIPDIANNNSYQLTSVLDGSTDQGPLRMTFDSPAEQPWIMASQDNDLLWEPATTNKSQSVYYKSFENPGLGQESWLVSPVLDLSKGTYSMFFDVSYARNLPADERLMVVASRDCGVTYTDVLMDRAASTLTESSSSQVWEPENNSDWRREYVNLDTLANAANVRIAFVVRNDNGNNLYLDNIELFEGSSPNPPITTAQYQLYYSSLSSQSDIALTLRLDKRQDIQVQILGMQGNLVGEYTLPDALNQTYYFDLSNQSSGLYIFRLFTEQSVSATKVFIGH